MEGKNSGNKVKFKGDLVMYGGMIKLPIYPFSFKFLSLDEKSKAEFGLKEDQLYVAVGGHLEEPHGSYKIKILGLNDFFFDLKNVMVYPVVFVN